MTTCTHVVELLSHLVWSWHLITNRLWWLPFYVPREKWSHKIDGSLLKGHTFNNTHIQPQRPVCIISGNCSSEGSHDRKLFRGVTWQDCSEVHITGDPSEGSHDRWLFRGVTWQDTTIILQYLVPSWSANPPSWVLLQKSSAQGSIFLWRIFPLSTTQLDTQSYRQPFTLPSISQWMDYHHYMAAAFHEWQHGICLCSSFLSSRVATVWSENACCQIQPACCSQQLVWMTDAMVKQQNVWEPCMSCSAILYQLCGRTYLAHAPTSLMHPAQGAAKQHPWKVTCQHVRGPQHTDVPLALQAGTLSYPMS